MKVTSVEYVGEKTEGGWTYHTYKGAVSGIPYPVYATKAVRKGRPPSSDGEVPLDIMLGLQNYDPARDRAEHVKRGLPWPPTHAQKG